jgi:hypothetical protein
VDNDVGVTRKERKVMKTMNKILVVSAVALAISAVPNVKADGALLSPRAQGNQIVHMTPDTNLTSVTMAIIVPTQTHC